MNMDNGVYNPYSRLKVPEPRVDEFFDEMLGSEEIPLPDEIKRIQKKGPINGSIHFDSVPTDKSIGTYTPTASIRAQREEALVVVENGEITHQSVTDYKAETPSVHDLTEEDNIDTTTVQYIKFYGADDEIIVHDLYRELMFDVLCELSRVAVEGYVNGIRVKDGELNPVWYDAGYEQRNVKIGVVENIDKQNNSETSESTPVISWPHENGESNSDSDNQQALMD